MTETKVAPVAIEKLETASEAEYDNGIGYLRAFTVLLVIAHHAALAYIPMGPPPGASFSAQPQWWRAFPVIDKQQWMGFGLMVWFNDVFFMSLMFFLSGLFVWGSLRRKGVRSFLNGRALRLGVPFVFAAAIVAPLAYWPA